MASSSNSESFIVEVGEEYPYPSHVIAPHFVTVKLSGKDKYDVWKTQMICLLRSHGMLGFIDDQKYGKRILVEDIKNAWMRSDSLVTGWILGSLSEEVAMEVVNCLTSKHNNTDFTAKDAWDELQRSYGPSVATASLHSFVDSDLEAEYRLEIALHLPEEERAFKLPKIVGFSNSSEPSNSTDPSNALVLATRNPMSDDLGNFAFDIEDLENMPRTKSKKTKAGGRRLPLRSEVKKLKPNETISIEDDPEQRSSSPPVIAAPLSQVLSSSSLKTIFGRVEQSVGVAMKDLDEAFKVMEKYKEEIDTAIVLKDKLEKREEDWKALSAEIAIMRTVEQQDKKEKKSFFKANQTLSAKNQELAARIKKLEENQATAKRVMMESAIKSMTKTKIKMATEAEAAGHKIDAWDISKWEEELLDMDDVVSVEEVMPNPEKVTAQVVKDLADQHMEEANEDKNEEQVGDNEKKDSEAGVTVDEGAIEGVVLASNDDLA